MNATALKIREQADPIPPSSDIGAGRAFEAAQRACGRIAPLWPLKNFVAVNPFLGMTDRRFGEVARVMADVAGARMTMPRAFYRDAIAQGRITDRDLDQALRRKGSTAPRSIDVAALHRQLQTGDMTARTPLPTVADVAGKLSGRDWASFACERISLWAAGYFDAGQALWPSSTRHLGPYAAWREEAAIDRTPQVMGLSGFHRTIGALPATAEAMIAQGAARLQMGEPGLADYFHRLLMSVGGWAGYARYQVWQSGLAGRRDDTLLELLAIRLAFEVALLETCQPLAALAAGWEQARARFAASARDNEPAAPTLEEILQDAYEIAWQRSFLARLAAPRPSVVAMRPAVQAAFCIDVRSETFRRALEKVAPEVETVGIAGFFGMPMEYVPLGRGQGGPRCPVLLAPGLTVHETVKGATAQEQADIATRRRRRLRAIGNWRWFKLAAVSSFTFVEAMGWKFAGKLIADSLGFTRPEAHPAERGIDAAALARLAPDITPSTANDRATGMTLETRIAFAEGALRAMSLRQQFARLVLFVGHGASSVNNPHASGLDCGACGGHAGDANARVAAAVLNDREVRQALAGRGTVIPDETHFLGALHDTTTDQLTIFDTDGLPATHADDLARLQASLAEAGRVTRRERAAILTLHDRRSIERQLLARSRDWSAVRPEWGLAGCASYIIAPRSRTAGIDLEGRAFLNSYDWQRDDGFRTLESIMTAPMIVGAWISLQYYGSTVDNRVFGSGNKVLHNVVGKLGVLEGNGGDLRTGLPMQSLHDGKRYIHEPLRLSVVIAAPLDAINAIVARHEAVRHLFDHGWAHLFALGDKPGSMHRYTGNLTWEDAA
ncbi:MAG: YbcC family protein [Rhodanobacter sp.]